MDLGGEGSYALGVLKGVGGALKDTVVGGYELGKSFVEDFSGTSSQIANGLLQTLSRPDKVVADFFQGKDDADAQAMLYRLQGNFEEAGRVEAKWDTEFSLNFMGPARAGNLGKVGVGGDGWDMDQPAWEDKINNQKTIDILEAETAALKRIALNSKGPDLTAKEVGTLRAISSDNKMGELIGQFSDKSTSPKDFSISIHGQTLSADPYVSKNAPVFEGASDAMVRDYFLQLAGADKLPSPKSVNIRGQSAEIYTLVRGDGVKLNLRNGSSSSGDTGARWTIDLIGSPSLKAPKVEVKFK